jgi:drug/metabolite transporter (DMT)-like permease
MTIRRAEFVLVLVTLLAAAGWLFSKNALQELPAFSFLAMRFTLAAMVLAMFCLPQLRSLNVFQILRSVVTGVIFGLALLVWIIGVQNTASIGESAFIVSLTVVVVPVFGRFMFGQSMPLILLVAFIPALAGLVFLTVDNGFVIEAGQRYFLIAIIGFALHLNLSNYFVKQVPSLANTTIQLAMVGLIAAVAASTREVWPTSISNVTWGWLIASALIATSFRFALQNYALKFVLPSYASMIMLLEPVWTIVLGVIFLSEELSTNKLIGCALIFTALMVFRLPMILTWLKSRSGHC